MNIPDVIYNIAISCNYVSNNPRFKYGGKETQYQSALDAELHQLGYYVQQEVPQTLPYTTHNNRTLVLSNDVRCRMDLLLPEHTTIIELKSISKLSDKDFYQILRYMDIKQKSWGLSTKGVLVNFNNGSIECWYLYYSGLDIITRVRIITTPQTTFDSLVTTCEPITLNLSVPLPYSSSA
jgi:GxxExxY protein